MIYITGDCHKDFSRFTTQNFPEQKQMGRGDYVIICGDFGGVWCSHKNSKLRKNIDDFDLNWLENKPFTTLFVDGNHENFDELYRYPVKEWNGGKVHELRPHILHLMRGEIFEICDKRILTFGGARSHDIQDGIIEWDEEGKWKKTAKKWERQGKIFRVNHYSWWKQELPTKEEIENAYNNLNRCNYKVDYIVTHCCPNTVLFDYAIKRFRDIKVAKEYEDHNILTDFFDEINQKVEFSKWFFGHHHDDMAIFDKHILLYYQIIRIA